jgi:AcrR family transcriptional regulator
MTRNRRSPEANVRNRSENLATRRGAESPRRRATEVTEAAAAVFAEKGYHGATTQDIADRLGIRQASLYYYIPSKEVALGEVCRLGVAGFVEQATAIAGRSASASDKVRALVREHLLRIHDRTAFVRVFLRERHHLPRGSRREVGALSREYERIVQGVIESGVASGEFRADISPRLLTLGLIGIANAASTWYGIEPDADVEKIAVTFNTMIVDGLAATAPRTSLPPARRRRAGRAR